MTPWSCFLFTFRQCCVNLACAPFFLLAVAVYAVYYCWPYMAQLPDHIHCAVVDADNSALSRRLVMEFRSTPDLNVIQVTDNRGEAILAMKSGEVSAIVEIPENFARNTQAAIPTAITMTANGAYLVGSKMATSGASGPLEAAAAKALANWLAERGADYSNLVLMQSTPPDLLIVPAYNTISGYLNFAVPIVFIAVFQTLMCAGMGMLFNSWYLEKKRPPVLEAALESPLRLFCVQAPIFLICFFWCLFVEGPVFYLQGINSFQNIPATLGVCAVFSLAVSSLASCVSLLLGPTHFVIQGVVLSALPCVFISGNLWPGQNMPFFFQVLGSIFPSTPGSAGIMRASQCGASFGEIGFYLLHLFILAVVYFLFALFLANCQLKNRGIYLKPEF